jgi:type IV fimbrial biogenesis protein FimT
MSTRYSARGLTLIELMIVVLVLGVLIALVAPSMRGMISTQRVRGVNAGLVTDLQFARGEAARRNRDVSVAVQASCYVVYVDIGLPATACDCSHTPGIDVCSDGRLEVKTVQLPAADGVALNVNSGNGSIVIFSSTSGALMPTSAAASAPNAFEVEVSGTPRGKLRTRVAASGRPSVCTPDASISGVSAC